MFELVDNNERRERIRNMVDQMQEIIRDPYHTENDTIADLEEQYLEEVRGVNSDLQECSNLLNKGLIPNVQQRARECDLLSRYNLLESVDRQDWIEILEIAKYKVSDEVLDEESEKQLNSCFAAGDRLEPHYREIRRLALEQAPVRYRLAEMRKVHVLLKKSQMGTKDWATDIRDFEVERQKQVVEEIDAAKKRLAFEELKLLVKELTAKSWLKPPAKEIVHHAIVSHANVAAIVSAQRMDVFKEKFIEYQKSGKVEADIEEYYPQLVALLKKWDQLQVHAKLPSTHQIMLDSRAAREYARACVQEYEMQEFVQRKLDTINHSVEVKADLREIDPIYHEMKSVYSDFKTAGGNNEFLQNRYEHVVGRYENYVNRIDTEGVNIRRLRMVGVVTLTIALVAAGGLYFQSRGIEADYVTRENHLKELVDGKQFEETKKFLEAAATIEDSFLTRPNVQALVAAFEKNESDENSRQRRVSSSLQNIVGDLQSAASLTAISTLNERIQEIEPDVRLQREQTDLANAKTALLRQKGVIQTTIDDSFSERMQAVTDTLEVTTLENMEALQAVITELEKLKQMSDVSPELIRPIEPLITRVDGMMMSEKSRKMRADRLRSINESIGSPARFQTQLQTYATSFAGTPRSLDFEKILKTDQAAWIEILEWNKIARDWSRKELISPSRFDAARYLTEAATVMENYKHDPRAKSLEAVIPYLKAIAARSDGEETIKSQLLQILQNPVVQIPYVVMNGFGDRYYLSEIPVRAAGRYQFKYFTGLDVSEKKFEAFETDKVALVRDGSRIRWTSPQLLFAEEATDLLSAVADGSYEEQMFGILEKLISDRTMDPLLKVILLQAMGNIMQKGSLPMQESLKPVFQRIEEAAVPTEVNYLDPADAEGKAARLKAERLLEKIEPVSSQLAKAQELRLQVSKLEFGPAFVWVGWLRKNDNSEWEVSALHPPTTAGDQLVAPIGNTEGGFHLKPLGSTKPGKYELSDTVDPSVLAQGRAVFMQQERD